jgi:hypothetical protein
MGNAGLDGTHCFPRLLWINRICPLCGSFEFKTAESGALDVALGIFSLRPVRCGNCWRRYYWFSRKDPISNRE